MGCSRVLARYSTDTSASSKMQTESQNSYLSQSIQQQPSGFLDQQDAVANLRQNLIERHNSSFRWVGALQNICYILLTKKAAWQVNQTFWNFYPNRSINRYEHLSHMKRFKPEMESSWITGPQTMLELFLSPLIIWCFVTLYRERWPEAKK